MNKVLFGFVALMGTAFGAVPQFKADSPPDASPGVPECELAKQWVADNLDALPTTLDAFSEHSITFRRTIYSALDTDVRISLWREHLAGVAHEVESPHQRLFLSEVSRDLNRYVQSTTPRFEIEALGEKAVAVLGRDLTHRALAALGPDPESTEVGSLPPDPDCYCSTESDWCNAWRLPWQPKSHCVLGSCEELDGCGLFLQFRCDGTCHRIVAQ